MLSIFNLKEVEPMNKIPEFNKSIIDEELLIKKMEKLQIER